MAVLWDVDGTLAETERDGHRVAFNLAFEAAGVPWRWSECRYGELLAVTGGRERLLRDMQQQADAPARAAERQALAGRLHALKNGFYAAGVRRAATPLREGVRELLDDCTEAGLAMGIVTTTSRANVDELLGAQLGAAWPSRFAVVVCGEDVARKKPDPQAYRMALDALGLAASQALAIEDAPAGVAAARGAGLQVIVTRSHYFRDAPVDGACAVGPSLGSVDGWSGDHLDHLDQADRVTGRVDLARIAEWHRAALRQQADAKQLATSAPLPEGD